MSKTKREVKTKFNVGVLNYPRKQIFSYPKHIILDKEFTENWRIRQDPTGYEKHPLWYLGREDGEPGYVFTNSILEWARRCQRKPFDTLYLGRKLQDLQGYQDLPEDMVLDPPTEAFGFKLKFPLWNWSRSGETLFPPDQNLIIRVTENK